MLTVLDLVLFFSGFPIPSLPSHFPISRHGIPHGPHPAQREGFAVWREGHSKDATAVVMGFDCAPGGEVWCVECDCRRGAFEVLEIPDPDFTHHISCGKEVSIGRERAALHWGRVAESRDEVTGSRVEQFDGRFLLWGGFIFPTAGKVLPSGRGHERTVRGEGDVPAPEPVGRNATPGSTRSDLVPDESAVVARGDEVFPIGKQDASACVGGVISGEGLRFAGRQIHCVDGPVCASGESGGCVAGDVEAKHPGRQFEVADGGEFHGSGKEFADGCDFVFHSMESGHALEFEFGMGIEAEGGEDSREKVLFVERRAIHLNAIRIGCAGDDTAFESASCHHEAPGVRVMVATSCRIDPGGASELAHGDDEGGIEESSGLEIVDEVKEDTIEFGDEHLMDLVLEHVVVPVHAVGDHDEWCSVLDEVPGHEGVLGKATWAIAFAIVLRKAFNVK